MDHNAAFDNPKADKVRTVDDKCTVTPIQKTSV